MLDSKLVLPYRDDEGIIRGETVLANKGRQLLQNKKHSRSCFEDRLV